MDTTVQGRPCRIHVPPGYTAGTTIPVVLLLHPLGADGPLFEEMTGFSVLADAAGFVAVYPNGSRSSAVALLDLPTALGWNAGGGFAPECVADDLAFLDAVMSTVRTHVTPDAARCYLVGMSNGGMLAYRAAAHAADRFAAMASVAGVMTVPAWAPAKPMPVLHVHGTADPFVPHAGGGRYPFISVDANTARVTSHHGITAPPAETDVTPAAPKDTLTVKRYDYRGAGPDPVVVRYEVEGGGHTWPGRDVPRVFPAGKLGAVTKNLDATQVIWEFLSKFTRT